MRTHKGNKNVAGVNIERIRRKKGMKQKELLAKMQISGCDLNASALSKMEGGTRGISDKELMAAAGGLGVEVSELFEEEKYDLFQHP
jgi:transcriptional regulator with XRE-family HTH domain